MISINLAAAYQQQIEAGSAPPPPPDPGAALTPGVKQMVADEVQRQIARENAERGQIGNAGADPGPVGIARAFSDNTPHVFVAGSDLFVTDATGMECGLSQGDVLQLAGPPGPDATTASAVILASKGQDCRKGNTISVELADLQNMQNQMRETIDQGLGEMQEKAGQSGGFPALPAAAKAPTVQAPFVADAPPPDPNALAQINQQAQEADNVEKEVATTAPALSATVAAPPGGPPQTGPPPETSVGQTIEQVVANNGQPARIAEGAGGKKIYMYKDMKVTFIGGKVTDVQ
jgi:hypothetical protein